ncbi:MAG: peroxiredoxin family protein [Promethearchaeota archaeon]|jgi:thiol-disulfide isomerase/thioredoxin
MKKRILQMIPLFIIVLGVIFFVTYLGIVALNESGNSKSYNTDLTYVDIDGNSINLTDHQGKVIILYFYLLSCSACKISDPLLAVIEDDYLSSQLLIITITPDPAETNSNLYNWKNNLNASWYLVRNDINYTYSSHWDLEYTPTTIIIDQNSNFVKKIIGSSNFDTNVRSEIDLLI